MTVTLRSNLNVKVFIKVFKTIISYPYHQFDSSLVWWYILVQNFAYLHPSPSPSTHPPPPNSCQGQGRSHVKTFMLKFYVKVFRTSLLLNQTMNSIYIWYYDIYWSKVQSFYQHHQHSWPWPCSQGHRLRILKVLKFSLIFFLTSLFPNLITNLIHLWFDDIYWSKILYSAIPPPPKVMSKSGSQNFPETKCAMSGELSCLATGLVNFLEHSAYLILLCCLEPHDKKKEKKKKKETEKHELEFQWDY